MESLNFSVWNKGCNNESFYRKDEAMIELLICSEWKISLCTEKKLTDVTRFALADMVIYMEIKWLFFWIAKENI